MWLHMPMRCAGLPGRTRARRGLAAKGLVHGRGSRWQAGRSDREVWEGLLALEVVGEREWSGKGGAWLGKGVGKPAGKGRGRERPQRRGRVGPPASV